MGCIMLVLLWSLMRFDASLAVITETKHSVASRLNRKPLLAALARSMELNMARADVLLHRAEQQYYSVAVHMSTEQQGVVVGHMDMIAASIAYICQDMMDAHAAVVCGLRSVRAQKAMGATYSGIERRVHELEEELRSRLYDLDAVLEGAYVS